MTQMLAAHVLVFAIVDSVLRQARRTKRFSSNLSVLRTDAGASGRAKSPPNFGLKISAPITNDAAANEIIYHSPTIIHRAWTRLVRRLPPKNRNVEKFPHLTELSINGNPLVTEFLFAHILAVAQYYTT
jgi:hypothetical protein